MEIITQFNELTKVVKNISPALDDASIQDDMRNIIFWVADGEIKVAGYNLYTTCVADMNVDIKFDSSEDPTGDYFIAIKKRELEVVLDNFTSLKKTTVESVKFVVREKELQVIVHEVASNKADEYAAKLEQNSKYRLTRIKVIENVKRELREAMSRTVMPIEPITVKTNEIAFYLDALIPSVKDDKRDSMHTRITFGDEFVYTTPQTYAALVRNTLPNELKNFIITNGIAKFLQEFCKLTEDIKIAKVPVEGTDIVLLILRNNTSWVIIKAIDIRKAFNINAQKEIPTNGIVLDKAYFYDVLKRIKGTNVETTISIKISEGSATCELISKAMTQGLPVINYKGSGEFDFTMKPDMLEAVLLKTISTNATYLFFYLDKDANGKVILCVTDDAAIKREDGSMQKLWHTYARGLTYTKGDFQWS